MRPTSKPASSDLYSRWKGRWGLKTNQKNNSSLRQITKKLFCHSLGLGWDTDWECGTRDLASRGLGFPSVFRRPRRQELNTHRDPWLEMPCAQGRDKCEHSPEGLECQPKLNAQTKVPADELTKKKLQNHSSNKTKLMIKPTVGLDTLSSPNPKFATTSHDRSVQERDYKTAVIKMTKKFWEISKRIKYNEKRARVSG